MPFFIRALPDTVPFAAEDKTCKAQLPGVIEHILIVLGLVWGEYFIIWGVFYDWADKK